MGTYSLIKHGNITDLSGCQAWFTTVSGTSGEQANLSNCQLSNSSPTNRIITSEELYNNYLIKPVVTSTASNLATRLSKYEPKVSFHTNGSFFILDNSDTTRLVFFYVYIRKPFTDQIANAVKAHVQNTSSSLRVAEVFITFKPEVQYMNTDGTWHETGWYEFNAGYHGNIIGNWGYGGIGYPCVSKSNNHNYDSSKDTYNNISDDSNGDTMNYIHYTFNWSGSITGNYNTWKTSDGENAFVKFYLGSKWITYGIPIRIKFEICQVVYYYANSTNFATGNHTTGSFTPVEISSGGGGYMNIPCLITDPIYLVLRNISDLIDNSYVYSKNWLGSIVYTNLNSAGKATIGYASLGSTTYYYHLTGNSGTGGSGDFSFSSYPLDSAEWNRVPLGTNQILSFTTTETN